MIEMETGRKLVGEQKEYIKMKREKTIKDREFNFDDDDEGSSISMQWFLGKM